MTVPPAPLDPFNITRFSHVRLTVQDIAASADFYVNLAGLVITEQDQDHVYLRGIEELCHHSLVLRRTTDSPCCDALGFRVFHEDDLDRAKAYFGTLGIASNWSEQPQQGKTLCLSGPSGIPLEFCARMPLQPRQITLTSEHIGGKALGLNHCQVVVSDVGGTGDAFVDMGFRIAEFIENTDTGERLGMFLHRKPDPHDIVFARGPGPRLHHFAYVTHNLQNMIQACDVAGRMGIGRDVERGPGRHGPGNGMFVYFRDPDGHRVELILPPLQLMDIEEEPKRWRSSDSRLIMPWGPAAPQRWIEEATHFTGVAVDTNKPMGRWHVS